MPLTSDYLLLNLLFFIIGLAVLLKSSDWFVEAACDIARYLHISELVIGLTIVSMGTSLPELATNLLASCQQDNSALAYGNIVGSNITNTLLILGSAAVLQGTIPVPANLFKRDGILMFCMTLLCLLLARFCGGLPRLGGLFFLLIFSGYMFMLFFKPNPDDETEAGDTSRKFKTFWLAAIVLVFSLAAVFLGAKAVLDNAIWLGHYCGVPKAVIAVTAVALGTSLPELVVTITGILKKRQGIALGNIIGSNIFNMQAILGLSAVINPLTAEPIMANLNIPLLLGTDMLTLIFLRTSWKLQRTEGIIMLAGYIVFVYLNLHF